MFPIAFDLDYARHQGKAEKVVVVARVVGCEEVVCWCWY
jgi:hypothetical protein